MSESESESESERRQLGTPRTYLAFVIPSYRYEPTNTTTYWTSSNYYFVPFFLIKPNDLGLLARISLARSGLTNREAHEAIIAISLA